MDKLSVYMITKNEELRLERTLQALEKIADEIVIVDSFSTDKTCDIALKYHAKIVSETFKNFSAQKQSAEKLCTHKWVFNVDADEVLSDEFIKELNALKRSGFQEQAYKVRVCDMFPGWEKPKRFARKFNVIRLYNRDFVGMPDDYSHDRPVFLGKKGRIGQLNSLILHYSYTNLTQLINKWNVYSGEFMKTAKGYNKKYSYIRIFCEFPVQFFKYYFLRRYIFCGFYGLVMALTCAYFRFVKVAKFKEERLLE